MRLGKQRHESKYLAIEDLNTNKGWSISWMCHQLGITRSAFYKWKHRTVPEQEQLNSDNQELPIGSIISIIRITQEREFTEL